MKFSSVTLALSTCLVGPAVAWIPPSGGLARPRSSSLRMAIDYNDPVVAEEFKNVQPLSWEEVEDELKESGIRVSQTMNDMEVKLMLVEMRLRKAGKLGGKKKQKPKKFASKIEELLWTKPAFEAFYTEMKSKGDNNALNVVNEYIQNKEIAMQRYGKDYKPLIRKIEAALTAPAPVKSPTLTFTGCKYACQAMQFAILSCSMYDLTSFCNNYPTTFSSSKHG